MAAAATITMPWTVSVGLNGLSASRPPATTAIPPLSGEHAISANILGVRPGVRFTSEFRTDYDIRLPFRISLTTQDTARAGQRVRVYPTVELAGTPSFVANGQGSFDTSVFVRGRLLGKNLDVDINLPDQVGFGGVDVRLGGTGTYSASDTAATPRSNTAGWRNRVLLPGGPVVSGSQRRYLGYEMEVTGEVNAWNARTDLLDLAAPIPVVGQAAAIASTVMDLDLAAQIELVERSRLMTGLLSGFYIDNKGPGFADDAFFVADLNDTAVQNVGFEVAIPADVSGSYEVEFWALSLGFGLLQELLYQPEVSLIFDPIFPFGEYELLSGNVGDPWKVSRNFTRAVFADFISDTDPRNAGDTGTIPKAARTLRWTIEPSPTALPPPPPVTAPIESPIAVLDSSLPADQIFFGFPSEAPPTRVEVIEAAVSAPAGVGFLGFAAVLALAARRRRCG